MPKYLLLAALVLIILWAPLPLGSNRAWSVGVLALALAACLPLAVWAFWAELPRYLALIKLPAIAFVLLFGYIQAQAAFGLGDLDDLLRAELGYAAAAMAFLMAFLLAAAKSAYARVLTLAFLIICTGYSAYGLIEILNPAQPLLWFDMAPQEGYVNGTFVNRNSFATYAGLGLTVGFALLLSIPRAPSLHAFGAVAGGPEGSSKDLNTIIFLLIAILITAAALLLTQSRGAIVATGAACLSYSVLSIRWRQFTWRAALVPGAALVLLSGFLLSLTGAGFLTRLGQDGVMDSGRQNLYEAALAMIGQRPLLGHGFGSFETTFPAFRPGALRPFPDFDKAHNGYLEIIAGLGIPMGLLFLGLFVWIVWRCTKGLLMRREGLVFPRLGIALSVLVALHSLLDYSLQIPAVGVSYAVLMGICVGQSYSRRQRRP